MTSPAQLRRDRRRTPVIVAPAEVAPAALTRAELRRMRTAPIVAEADVEPIVLEDVEVATLSAEAPDSAPAAPAPAEEIVVEPMVVETASDDSAPEPVIVDLVDVAIDNEPENAEAAPESASGDTDIPVAPDDVADDVDAFEQACKLYPAATRSSFSRRPHASRVSAASSAPARAPRASSGRAIAARVAAGSFSVGVMAIVGVLAVGTTTPAPAVAAFTQSGAATTSVAAPVEAERIQEDEIQAYVSSSSTQAQELDRQSGYDVASMADLAADAGVQQFSGAWVSDPNADVQWPFAVGVPISAQFGSQGYSSRWSRPHRGVDFTPGLGAEIHVVAGGTVRVATEAGGDYGVTVVVDHEVDGQMVSTRYAHMQYGSLNVAVGDTVSVGDVLGTVGSTGRSTGAHLHFEVLINGVVHTDPISWMREHTEG